MTISASAVAATLSRHIPMYRWHAPTYQVTMLSSLEEIWEGPHETLLDLGGGTGIIAEALQAHLPAGKVTAVDVENRFLDGLSVDTLVYDGRRLPFDDASFDAATMNNVMHHVPVEDRRALVAELRRVVRGPVYIKDHVALRPFDHHRLAALDLMGNLPFSGMVRARYLSPEDWFELAAAGGYRIVEAPRRRYRGRAFAAIFPNRLETVMKWVPAPAAG